jgi:hypothetical protein
LFNGALGTPSSGTVTNLTGTASININGTVGATTATTGAFTTLAASGAVTLSGGTANGVTYLNGSKVLTSGSALVFDGTKLGIGTSSPPYKLSVSDSGATGFEVGPGTTYVAGRVLLQSYNRSGSAYTAFDYSASEHKFQVSGSDAMVLTSTGLGIGTSSPAQKLHVSVGRIAVSNGYNIGSTDGNTGMFIGTNSVSFQTNANTVATFDSAGGFKTLNTIGVGNATPSTSGAGITFPATQSASTDANTLDDYEEGTWTPSLGGTATYTSQVGRYTKVGRLVTFQCSLTILLIGTGSTTQISGLPFTAAFNSGNGGHAIYYDTIDSSVSQIVGYIGTTNIVLVSTTAFANSIGANAIFKNGTTLTFQGFYFV